MAARFTHLALPCRDLDTTIAWYEAHTPMRAFHRRVDADAEVAWLAEVMSGGGTTVGLVVVQTFEAKASGKPRPIGYLCTLRDPDGMRWCSVSVRNKGAFGS